MTDIYDKAAEAIEAHVGRDLSTTARSNVNVVVDTVLATVIELMEEGNCPQGTIQFIKMNLGDGDRRTLHG